MLAYIPAPWILWVYFFLCNTCVSSLIDNYICDHYMCSWFATAFQRRSCRDSLVSRKVAHWTFHPAGQCSHPQFVLKAAALCCQWFWLFCHCFAKVSWAKPTALRSPVASSECRQPGLTAQLSPGFLFAAILNEVFFVLRRFWSRNQWKNGCVLSYLETCVHRLGINWRHFISSNSLLDHLDPFGHWITLVLSGACLFVAFTVLPQAFYVRVLKVLFSVGSSSAFSILTDGYGSIPIDTFLVGWTSIYQLFWGSPGVQGFDPSPSVLMVVWS